MSDLGDCRDILHFEAQRARRFQVDQARVRTHQFPDSGANQRVIIGDRDAEPGENLIAKSPRRAIGAVGDQDVIAGMDDGQEGAGDGREPRRQQRHAGALRSFQVLDGELERFGGRRAAPAILVARTMGEKILGASIEHG